MKTTDKKKHINVNICVEANTFAVRFQVSYLYVFNANKKIFKFKNRKEGNTLSRWPYLSTDISTLHRENLISYIKAM